MQINEMKNKTKQKEFENQRKYYEYMERRKDEAFGS